MKTQPINNNQKNSQLTFNEKCYALLRQIPKGKVTTYKLIAKALNTKAYQAVGNAMNKNPDAPQVPCHRVVNVNGEIGKYALGTEKKIQILESEGIKIDKKTNKIIEFEKVLYEFK